MMTNYFDFDSVNMRLGKRLEGSNYEETLSNVNEFNQWLNERDYSYGSDMIRIDPDGSQYIVFRNDEDAFEFKMRWL